MRLIFFVFTMATLLSCSTNAEWNKAQELRSFDGDVEITSPLNSDSPIISRRGSSLFEGDKPFRFLSVNIPNYHIVEDAAGPFTENWHRVTSFEQRDAAQTVRRMGGRAFRIYVPAVEGGGNNSRELSHIYLDDQGEITYNEELFQDLDRGIAIAAEQGLRVIIPFVDNWSWFGGWKEWEALAGSGNFWVDENQKETFKEFIYWFLNRENTVNGILYKNDPAILCWELGNEIDEANETWIAEMASYIKSIDSEHLIMDGSHKQISRANLKNPDIDIITNHYNDRSIVAYARKAKKWNKAYIYGEFRFDSMERIDTVSRRVIDSAASGALLWSLRFRTEYGGFYFHNDFQTSDSIHYPGFDETEPDNEKEMISRYREYAYEIRGYNPPREAVPEQVHLLYVSEEGDMSWQGAAGSLSYIVERQDSRTGEWITISEGISDAGSIMYKGKKVASLPLYTDAGGDKGDLYRVIAENESGKSEPSNTVVRQGSH